jgi:putative ABC transport system permease protein
MSVLADVAARLRALLFRERQEQELDEELRDHLERDIAERVRRGATPEIARREALVAFGGVERVKEDVRDATGVRLLQDVASDIRYALRALRLNPGFTIAAVLVLGIGIGATTTAFTFVNGVLLAALPYPHAERLVRVFPTAGREMQNLSTVDYQAIRDQQRSFDAFGGMSARLLALSGAGAPERILAGRVTAGFFQALSVQAAEGRLVDAADEVPGAPAVVVVSHALAEQRLGGAQAAVGKAITLDGVSHTVIGVLAGGPRATAGLAGLRASVWPALQMTTPTRRGPFWIRGIARLREGVTVEDATRDLGGISVRIYPIWESSWQGKNARFTPVALQDAIVGPATRGIGLVTAAVALVLLVAIANVATLLLVRASARAHELAVRVALGATPSRLARLLLVEGLTVMLFAGVVGIGLAALGIDLVRSLVPGLPRIAEISFNAASLGFAALVTLVAGTLVSLPPVMAALAGQGSESLRADARRAGTTRRANVVRRTLVVAEFALALPLLLGAGLLFNTFLRLQRVNPGFDPVGVASVGVVLPGARYTDTTAQQFWRQIEARVAELPAVASVGLSTELPPEDPANENNFDLVDRPVPPGTGQPVSPWVYATNGYFATLGVGLLEGRLFTEGDSAAGAPVVVVSQSWAERFFPNERVLGRQLISGGCIECPRTTIVGVVGDVKYLGLKRPGEAVYEPFVQGAPRSSFIIVRARSAATPGETFRALRGVIGGLDPELPVSEATMVGRLEDHLADPRTWTAVIGGFGAATMLLAALGIYGLMAYMVRQRRREIGVRLALGAEPRSVMWMVVGQGMRLSALGSFIGLVFAVLQARWLQGMLFQVGVTDPMTVVSVAAVLLAAAFFACWLPGRSASRISPVEAMMAE